MSRTRTVPVELPVDCTVCGGKHVLHGTAELVRQRIAFGGGPDLDEAATYAPWKLTVTCPRQGKPAEVSVLVPTNYDESLSRVAVESVSDASSNGSPTLPANADEPPPPSWLDEELQEWRKNTVATQRAFATTMLTTSSGGVAVYFAVLKYLGWDQAHFSAPLVILTVLPPVLLLLAAMAFALALRPSLSYIDHNDYAAFRARRIGEMHRRITVGTALYVASLVLAITVFLAILEAVS